MTAPHWLDRPPTAEEVRAHAAAHPCIRDGETSGLWLLNSASWDPEIFGLSPEDNGAGTARGLHEQAREPQWLPLTAEGLPVEAPQADHAHDEPKARDNEFHRLWTSCVGEPGYVKSEWTALLREFEAANHAGRGEAAADVLRRARKLAGVEWKERDVEPESTTPTILEAAQQALAEPDPEHDCLRCGTTMAAPDRSDGEEESPLCNGCAWQVLELLAAEVARGAEALPAKEPTRPASHARDILKSLSKEAFKRLPRPSPEDIQRALDEGRRQAFGEHATVPPTLERRLLEAREASGRELGELICLAMGFGETTPGDVTTRIYDGYDDDLVSAVERWVREHPRGAGR